VGRIRYTAQERLNEDVPFQSVDRFWRVVATGLFATSLRSLHPFPVSAVQRNSCPTRTRPDLTNAQPRISPSCRGATHIVKFWEPTNFSARCERYSALKPLSVAVWTYLGIACRRRDGPCVDRFDLRPDGTYRALKILLLNARRTMRSIAAAMKRQ